ncbi:143R [Invertebrate iridescent virus Kaz2018]|nr:143R [Invertebrate iridescent virus Kaz2018]
MTIICIDGLIGAGKSTVTHRLKKNLYKCYEEPIDKWTLLPNLYNDMKKYATPFQFQVLFSQYDQYLSFKDCKETVVVERCPWTSKNIFTSLMIENNLFDLSAIDTYNNLYERLSYQVDHFIYIKVDSEMAFERIKKRDRFAEQNISFDYLKSLENKYATSLATLSPSTVTIIDGSNTIEEVEFDVKTAINNFLSH